MCTTYSTRNRAVIFNGYTVQTLLVDAPAYCPCARNRQDYSVRSRLYNPDPKYQCHEDLTCHTYDSIPKGISCFGYGGPSPPYPVNPGQLPCFANGPCYPPNENSCPPEDECRCVRRRRKPPACCTQRTTYRDLICSMECCDPCTPPPCEQQQDDCQGNKCAEEEDECCKDPTPEGGYSVTLCKDRCGRKVTYNCDPCGNVCRQVQGNGNQSVSEITNSVVLETNGPCCPVGPCGELNCSTVESADDQECCPVTTCGPPIPRTCCTEEMRPRPCKRPLLRCPLRTHNYCRCMACSPRFWICTKPCSDACMSCCCNS